MNIKQAASCLSALMLLASTAGAAHVWEDSSAWWDGHFRYDRGGQKFNANELSLDLFGSYINPEEEGIDDVLDTDLDDGAWGGGLAMNYFFTRHFGISAEADAYDNSGHFVDQVLASAVLRLPIDSIGLAPYIMGGVGGGTEPDWEWLWHAGVGLEFRLNPTVGVFVDSRYIWADDTVDRLQFRGGIRLVF